jgi:hypothetical protein
MADIKVERKGGSPWLWWIIGLIILALIIWGIVEWAEGSHRAAVVPADTTTAVVPDTTTGAMPAPPMAPAAGDTAGTMPDTAGMNPAAGTATMPGDTAMGASPAGGTTMPGDTTGGMH